jgi:hypothetical protein
VVGRNDAVVRSLIRDGSHANVLAQIRMSTSVTNGCASLDQHVPRSSYPYPPWRRHRNKCGKSLDF